MDLLTSQLAALNLSVPTLSTRIWSGTAQNLPPNGRIGVVNVTNQRTGGFWILCNDDEAATAAVEAAIPEAVVKIF